MTKIYAIGSQKGGVGKTTTTVTVSHGLARRGKRVLTVDTDTQGHVARYFGLEPKRTLYEFVLDENLQPKDVLLEVRDNLFIMPGGNSLAKLERHLAQQSFGVEHQLKDALTPLLPYFDYVMIDAAPGWNVLAVNVLFCADHIITPVALESLAVDGLFDYVKQVVRMGQRGGVATLHTVLPTMLDRRYARTAELLTQLTDFFGAEVMGMPIRTNAAIAELPAHHETVYEYESASGKGVTDYDALVERILNDD